MKNHGAASTGAPMKKADASPFWESLPFSPPAHSGGPWKRS